MGSVDELVHCEICYDKFEHNSDLIDHLYIHHDIKMPSELLPKSYFECSECNERFAQKDSLTKHFFTHHIDARLPISSYTVDTKSAVAKKNCFIICPLCRKKCFKYKKLVNHIFFEHQMRLEFEHYCFNSWEEFQDFKTKLEQTQMSSFIPSRTKKKDNSLLHATYACSRSMPCRKNAPVRGNKLDVTCPARLETHCNGKIVTAVLQRTHLGHSEDFILPETDENVKLELVSKSGVESNCTNLVNESSVVVTGYSTMTAELCHLDENNIQLEPSNETLVNGYAVEAFPEIARKNKKRKTRNSKTKTSAKRNHDLYDDQDEGYIVETLLSDTEERVRVEWVPLGDIGNHIKHESLYDSYGEIFSPETPSMNKKPKTENNKRNRDVYDGQEEGYIVETLLSDTEETVWEKWEPIAKVANHIMPEPLDDDFFPQKPSKKKKPNNRNIKRKAPEKENAAESANLASVSISPLKKEPQENELVNKLLLKNKSIQVERRVNAKNSKKQMRSKTEVKGTNKANVKSILSANDLQKNHLIAKLTNNKSIHVGLPVGISTAASTSHNLKKDKLYRKLVNNKSMQVERQKRSTGKDTPDEEYFQELFTKMLLNNNSIKIERCTRSNKTVSPSKKLQKNEHFQVSNNKSIQIDRIYKGKCTRVDTDNILESNITAQRCLRSNPKTGTSIGSAVIFNPNVKTKPSLSESHEVSQNLAKRLHKEKPTPKGRSSNCNFEGFTSNSSQCDQEVQVAVFCNMKHSDQTNEACFSDDGPFMCDSLASLNYQLEQIQKDNAEAEVNTVENQPHLNCENYTIQAQIKEDMKTVLLMAAGLVDNLPEEFLFEWHDKIEEFKETYIYKIVQKKSQVPYTES